MCTLVLGSRRTGWVGVIVVSGFGFRSMMAWGMIWSLVLGSSCMKCPGNNVVVGVQGV